MEGGLLYIFQSDSFFCEKSASLGHISGWDRVSSTGMSRLRELDRETEELRMSDIVGTIATVESYLSKKDVTLSVTPENDSENCIKLVCDREYKIPLFQREIRWNKGNVNILLSDLLNGSRFLGNIILSISTDNLTCEIIDGQQRTTILLMIIECIKHKYADEIELFDTCPIINESFPEFQNIVKSGFNPSKMPAQDWDNAKKGDVYKQFSKIESLWKELCESEIICNRHQAKKMIDNLKSSEFNIIASYSSSENVSIRYFLDVNLKGVQLDTEDIFKGYLFSQDSRTETRVLWQDIKQLSIKFNTAKDSPEEKRYPLMKLYEHFFRCDLYLSKPNGQDFSEVEFKENFCLAKRVVIDNNTFFEGTHIIDVICNAKYLKNSLLSIKSCLEIMIDVISTEGPSDKFKGLFLCDKKMDSVDISNCHLILKKILLEQEVIPKVLVMKYILSFFDGSIHTKSEYKSIYSVFTACVIFTIFAPKKESESFYTIVSSEEWCADINLWLSEYSLSSKMTRGKLLAAFKYSDIEDTEENNLSYRCKSLASIHNYIKVKNNCGSISLKASTAGDFKSYFENNDTFSVEHFIIGENGTLQIKTDKVEFNYSYPPTIKKYRNSLFNFIFIPKELNSNLGNTILSVKINDLNDHLEKIKCRYSKEYLNLISCEKYFGDYPTQEKLNLFNSQEEITEYLDKYFTRSFPEEFLIFATELSKIIQPLNN